MPKKSTENIELRSQWGYAQNIHFRVSKKFTYWSNRPNLWHPPTDLLETEENFVVRMEIAGMEHAEMTIAIEDLSLAIHGSRNQEVHHAAYHQMEVRYGEFLSLVELPAQVDTNQIAVHYDDGFLQVNLPKVVT